MRRLRRIRHLPRRIRPLPILLNLLLPRRLRSPPHHLLNRIDRSLRAAPLRHNHLPALIDGKNAALRLLGRAVLHADGGDEGVGWVAEEGVGEGLLGFEGGVCFRAVAGEAVDGVAGGGEGWVAVAEETGLGGAVTTNQRQLYSICL